jgi:hypothetical protein
MVEQRSFVAQVTLGCNHADFSELLVQIRSIINITPVEVHLKPFGNKLNLVPKLLGQNTRVVLGVGYFAPKSFGSSDDDLLSFRQ